MKYFKTYQYLVYILITATEILYLLNWFWVSLLRGTFIEYSVLLSGRSAKLFARLNCKFGQCVLGPKLNSARKQTTTRIREALFIWYTIGLETLQHFAGQKTTCADSGLEFQVDLVERNKDLHFCCGCFQCAIVNERIVL